MKIEILPQAEVDIISQFRFYLVDRDAPEVAVRFREAVIVEYPGAASEPSAWVDSKGIDPWNAQRQFEWLGFFMDAGMSEGS